MISPYMATSFTPPPKPTHLVSSLGREWVGCERILATEWISSSSRGGGGVCGITTRGNSCGGAKRVILE